MPSVSLTRVSASTCGRSSLTSVWRVRRCRSSASLTRSRSSLIAADTVSSSARLRPLRLPRACSSSSSLGICAGEVEGLAQAVQRRVLTLAVGNVIEQLTGRFGRRIRRAGRRSETVLDQRLPCFAFHAGEGLAHATIGLERAIAQRAGDRRSHPQHAAQGFDLDLRQQ